MEIVVYNTQGEKVKTLEILDEIFKVDTNLGVVHGVVKAYLANKRQGTHATKRRADVRGTGKKPQKQKGSGRARQGSVKSPLMRGGAVVHGPQPRDYRQKINRKTKNLALKIVLSDKVQAGCFIVVDSFQIKQYKTKQVSRLLDVFCAKKALFLEGEKDDFLYRSARNLPGVCVQVSCNLNALDVLSADKVIVSEYGFQQLSNRFWGG